MKTKAITYHKVFSLGNYENEKIGVEIEIQEGDDVQKAIQQARDFVEFNHKLNGFKTELQHSQYIVANPDEYTGRQVQLAKQKIEEIEEQINGGSKLLISSSN